MNRRTPGLRLAAAALTLAVATACGPRSPRPLLPPDPDINILIVSFDALRADALGTYGYHLPTSPNIDAFASRSFVFERAYAAAPVTPTSFAGAFTGHLPHRVFRGWRFQPERTLAEVFRDGGYHTAAFMNNVQLTDERNFDQGFEHYRFFRSIDDLKLLHESMTWLREHRDEPFFQWIHFLSPHSPYDYRALAADFYDYDYQGEFERTTKGKFDTDSAVDVARIRSLYDGEIKFADFVFGRLLSNLDELELRDDTLILLTSDHGEEFKERGGFQHQRLYEETVRVPLIVHHPRLDRGRRVEFPVSNLDFLPNLVAVVGLEAPTELDGQAWRPDSDETVVVSEAMTDSDYRGIMILRGQTKLIQNCKPELSLELYDLSTDPGERSDVSRERRRDTTQLRTALEALFGAEPCTELQRAVAGKEPTEGLDPAVVRELRALGYVG